MVTHHCHPLAFFFPPPPSTRPRSDRTLAQSPLFIPPSDAMKRTQVLSFSSSLSYHHLYPCMSKYESVDAEKWPASAFVERETRVEGLEARFASRYDFKVGISNRMHIIQRPCDCPWGS
uniref:Uncharacterized protein n=1 Tax=Mycena chlorophos TaxID=658473 RepID=A0ABQ0KYY9_MYCCL|nr:predicted protein [Mycena chlorophos]